MIFRLDSLPGYAEPFGLLCDSLLDTTREWRGEIPAELSAEAMTWRIRPGGQSMGALMLHIIGVEIGWLEEFALDQTGDATERALLMRDEINVDEGVWPDAPAQPLSWYFDLHDRIRARTLESMKRWPSGDTVIPSKRSDNQFSLPWVLSHVIQHEAYHGGQIVLLHDVWSSVSA